MNAFIKKPQKPNQEKEATLWDLGSWYWKDQTVKFHSVLFLPFHHLRILRDHSAFRQMEKQITLEKSKPAGSSHINLQLPLVCVCLEASSFFSYIGYRPDLCIKQVIQYWLFSVVYTLPCNSLLYWITWFYKVFRGSAGMNTTREYETSFDQLSFIVIYL